MKTLIYKEIKLSISRFFWIIPFILGALLLIPQWVYLVALMYLFWITVPNLYGNYNSQNDRTFCMLMPIKKSDYVLSKIISLSLLELTHLFAAGIFAIIHNLLFPKENFMLDLNLAFFGVGFLMYGLFNLIFYIFYFKTGYFFGKAVIYANVVAFLFAAIVELSVIFIPAFKNFMEGQSSIQVFYQTMILIVGALLFVGLNYVAFLVSKKKFERIDL